MRAALAPVLGILVPGVAALLAQQAMPLAQQTTPPAQQTTLVVGAARLLDEQDGWREPMDILVQDHRIARIARAAEIDAPAGTKRIDVGGAFVLPGLVDLHSHLLLHPYDEAAWDDQVLKEPLELRTIRAVAAARRTLEAGFTTLRDLGTEGAGYADVALRDAIARGIVPGPRIFATTRALVASSCYGPSGYDPRWVVPKGAQEATGADAARAVVREQIAAGADWIKVYADYARGHGRQATPTFTQAELEAIVDEARSAGRPVAAHATTDEGMRRAVLAGVRTIEHGYGASDATLQLMRERGVFLCPTLAAVEATARYAGWKQGMPEPPRLAQSRDTFRRALAAGVRIANGSDVGVFAHGENARELELLVAYGMTPAQAIHAATDVAAEVLGRAKDLGRVAPGYLADLVAFRDDPLHGIAPLRRPLLVVKDGAALKR